MYEYHKTEHSEYLNTVSAILLKINLLSKMSAVVIILKSRTTYFYRVLSTKYKT